MTRCAFCGAETFAAGSLCPHHLWRPSDDWAAGNRIMCDFIHRRIVAPDPPPEDGSYVAFVQWAA